MKDWVLKTMQLVLLRFSFNSKRSKGARLGDEENSLEFKLTLNRKVLGSKPSRY